MHMEDKQIAHDIAIALSAKHSDDTPEKFVELYFQTLPEVEKALKAYHRSNPKIAKIAKNQF